MPLLGPAQRVRGQPVEVSIPPRYKLAYATLHHVPLNGLVQLGRQSVRGQM